MFVSRYLTLAISESMSVGFSLFCGDVMSPGDVNRRVRRAICCSWRADLVRDPEGQRSAAAQKVIIIRVVS